MFLVKEDHSVPVKVSDIVLKLSELREIRIGMDHCHELVIRVRIVEMIIIHSTLFKYIDKSVSCKSLGNAVSRITFDSLKVCSEMIFRTSGKILKSKTVLYSNYNSSALFKVSVKHSEKLLVRIVRSDISLSVLKHADKEYIIKISVKIRLNIPEVSHVNGHVSAFFVPVGIDL